jgi:hypothetical protein
MEVLQGIKQRVSEVMQKVGPDRLFEGVDPVLLRKATEEVRRAVAKYGSVDRLAAKLISKEKATNEGVATTYILSVLGFHYFVKLIKAIKDKDPIISSILEVPDDTFLKAIGHFVAHVVAVLYLILYPLGRINWYPMVVRSESGDIAQFRTRWSGPHDYYLTDSKKNRYDLVWIGGSRYEVLKDGVKVMDCEDTGDGFVFKGPDGRARFTEVSMKERDGRYVIGGKTVDNPKFRAIDLVRDMDRKQVDKHRKEINLRKAEIERLNREIDSLEDRTWESYSKSKTTNMRIIKGYNSFGMQADITTESVDMAKKIFRDNNMDWMALTRTTPDQWHKLKPSEQKFLEVREELRKSNNLGYLGVFAKVLASKSPTKAHDITLIHTLLMEVMPVMANLRGPSGDKVSIFDLEDPEQMVDSLTRLAEWRKVNQFMRQLPPTQKAMVWPDGWWAPELKGNMAFLNKAIIKMTEDGDLSKRLLSKISAVKTPKQFLGDVERLSQDQPEEYDQLLAKLGSTRGVIVTWESRQRNAIICMVLTYRAIKKVAAMTNWCIVRSESYFDQYTRDGLQFVLFDLNEPNTSDYSVIGFTLGNQSMDPLWITACHDRSDDRFSLPKEFLDNRPLSHQPPRPSWAEGFTSRAYPRVLPEYVSVPDVDLSKILTDPAQRNLAIHKIKTLKKAAMESIRRFLNKPGISKFIDWWA